MASEMDLWTKKKKMVLPNPAIAHVHYVILFVERLWWRYRMVSVGMCASGLRKINKILNKILVTFNRVWLWTIYKNKKVSLKYIFERSGIIFFYNLIKDYTIHRFVKLFSIGLKYILYGQWLFLFKWKIYTIRYPIWETTQTSLKKHKSKKRKKET